MGSTFPLLALTVVEISVSAETLMGRVVGVADGDTLTVLVEGNRPIRVRLAGIDAPEHDQPFGQRSRRSLAELTLDRPATVTVWKIDDYGRIVGMVIVGAIDVEAEQVWRGLAWVYRHYSDDARLLALEAEAKAARRGLWADANPIPPWDWRHGEAAGRLELIPTRPVFAGRCGAKSTCREMTSCEEARFYLTQCGVSRLDGDKDGTPCEGLCR
ncbi:MAG: thermonuclease family protein [Candidatus Contendobacter sp.]|nr:thermonuclease family protein [Candidatus Contendobacter sp.]MDG4558845.1 thermonuclease family protein [Candidatus Contendobacter sp.]